jgi:hypothetical protein
VDSSLTVALDAADFLFSLQPHFICLLDGFLATMHSIHLSRYDSSLELVTLSLLNILLINLLEQPFLIVDVELIGELVAEHVILLEVLNRIDKQVLKGGTSYGKALHLLQALLLLLSLDSSLIERLILLLDALYFSLDFPCPLISFLGETLVAAFLKSSYFIYFGFLFYF